MNVSVRTTMAVSLPDAVCPGHRFVAELAPFTTIPSALVIDGLTS